MSKQKDQKGFTLLEVILAMVILGFMGVIATSGIFGVLEGYIFAREISKLEQQAQMTLTRIERELSYIKSSTNVSSSSVSSITYTVDFPTGTETHTISYDSTGDSIQYISGANSNTLAENVQSLTFNYLPSYDSSANITSFQPTTRIIDVTVVMRANGEARVFNRIGNSTFSTRITPYGLTN